MRIQSLTHIDWWESASAHVPRLTCTLPFTPTAAGRPTSSTQRTARPLTREPASMPLSCHTRASSPSAFVTSLRDSSWQHHRGQNGGRDKRGIKNTREKLRAKRKPCQGTNMTCKGPFAPVCWKHGLPTVDRRPGSTIPAEGPPRMCSIHPTSHPTPVQGCPQHTPLPCMS